ncbi:DUF2271 domain-containing protein [Marinobacter panjinensis]|uniref:DUF2271 domain-containing protein n=1 Tax=Marinobacter panjinensis TaxID=2576384 RepID=A0A4U6R2D3_9GAMM|nr:DUF2271 domain-containing protein [Marinobacter panjinensis]MCR8915711.1 DUF2271 domain-containing protein [Marinobacter panjinensis]TKV66948.1 DUF2271 domain-containing protein [Marinobacter panjinensis]
MKKILFALGLAIALAVPTVAQAREVTFTTELLDYGGDGAYLALYLTDAAGKYQGTLWVAGKKTKYYKHLSGWARGSRLNPAEYDGLTGASITSGRTLKITLDLEDALVDTGYEIRVDTSVEDMRDNRADIALPLTSEGAGKAVAGRGYVRSFRYDF